MNPVVRIHGRMKTENVNGVVVPSSLKQENKKFALTLAILHSITLNVIVLNVKKVFVTHRRGFNVTLQ